MINSNLGLCVCVCVCVCVCMCVCLCAEEGFIFKLAFWASLFQIKVVISREPAIILSYIVTKLGPQSKLEKWHAAPVMPSNYDVFIIFLIYYWFGAQKQNIEGETFIKNNHVSAISIFKEHSFQILYPTIHSNKSFKSLRVLLIFMS